MAVGRMLGYGASQASGPVTIVGVVQDSKYNDARERPLPMVFVPYWQFPSISGMTFELRTAGEPPHSSAQFVHRLEMS